MSARILIETFRRIGARSRKPTRYLQAAAASRGGRAESLLRFLEDGHDLGSCLQAIQVIRPRLHHPSAT